MSMVFHDFYRKYITDIMFTLAAARATNSEGVEVSFEVASEDAIRKFKSAHDAGGKTIILGNGGSAAIASHQAFDRWKNGRLRTIAFNDSSLLTGGANDFGYSEVFTHALEMFATEKDVVVAISSSGQSANIINAAKKAKSMGCFTVTFSAFKEDNPLRTCGDLNFYLNTGTDLISYGFAELGHETILHAMLDYHMAIRDNTI